MPYCTTLTGHGGVYETSVAKNIGVVLRTLNQTKTCNFHPSARRRESFLKGVPFFPLLEFEESKD